MIHNVDPQLSQWDVGRVVSVSDTNATHVHFANQGDSKAVVVEIKDGTAEIPDYLLQTGKTLIAYCVLHESDTNRVTLESKSFSVRKRERPEDYVYEKSQRDYIYELITDAQTATEAANQATQNANDAAEKANQAAKSWVIMGEVKGESVVIDDAIDQTFAGFRIFGKTTQDGTPTPDAPVELVSVENPTVAVNEQSMLVPYTLHGIPVSSGGNYDEIDLDRGVYIQRTGKWVIDGSIAPSSISEGTNGGTVLVYTYANVMSGISTKRTPKMCDKLQSTTNVNPASYKDCKVGFWSFNTAMAQDIYLIFNVGEFATEEEASAYLRANPITFIGILAIPIETPLSEEELAAYAALHTSRGITTVSNDAGAYMDIAYVMDAKKYIDSLVGSSAGLLNATVE